MRAIHSIGDRVNVVGFGMGRVLKVIRRKHDSWTHPEYYLIKLDKAALPAIFGPHELHARTYHGLSSPRF